MEMLLIKDGVIIEHYCSDHLLEGCIEIEDGFFGTVGEPINWYDEHWKRISDVILIQKGIKDMPKGMKIENGKLVEMKQEEKILAGFENMPKGMKIENGLLKNKSPLERYKDGESTKEEFASFQRLVRDSYLLATDKYMTIDFPISDEKRDVIKKYRQQLRDITKSPLFPDVEIPEPPLK